MVATTTGILTTVAHAMCASMPRYPTQAAFWNVGLFLVGLSLADGAFAQASYRGKVIHIADGDTLTVLMDRQQVKIRLANIDAPERGQAYGAKAKKVLGNLVFGEKARVEVTTKDRWKRSVARVLVGRVDVNAEMVRRGYAWVYREYSTDAGLIALENEAKVARRDCGQIPDPCRHGSGGKGSSG